MDPVVVIAALKVSGALLGGVLGVMGVLINFKRPDNRISNWGVVVLVGISASAAAGIFGSIAEGYKAKSEATLQSARTEALLKELSRAVQPITQLEITYWATLPSEAPELRDYIDRVSRTIDAQKDRLRRVTFGGDKGIHVTASDIHGEPITIDLGVRSRLWPRANEPPVGQVALAFHLGFFIRKSPIEPEKFQPVVGAGSGLSDWSAITFPPVQHQNRLTFDRRTRRFVVFGSTDFPKTLWHSNGQITSITDIYGAQLLLTLPHAADIKFPEKLESPPRFDRQIHTQVVKLSRMLELQTIVLKLREGRSIWISGNAFKKTMLNRGYPVFSVVLPSDEAGFQKLLSRDE